MTVQTYAARDLLPGGKHAHLFEKMIDLLVASFMDDDIFHWVLHASNADRKSYAAWLRICSDILFRLGLLSDATVTVVLADGNDADVDIGMGGKSGSSPALDDEKKRNQMEASSSSSPSPSISFVKSLVMLVPPHGIKTLDSTWAIVRAGGYKFPFQMSAKVTWRVLSEFVPTLDRLHKGMFPHSETRFQTYELLYAATHPTCQGQGLGRKLLLHVQEMVKNQHKIAGMPCSIGLESSSEGSRRLYARTGFVDCAEVVYGTLRKGESVSKADDGSVLGATMYGMIWSDN